MRRLQAHESHVFLRATPGTWRPAPSLPYKLLPQWMTSLVFSLVLASIPGYDACSLLFYLASVSFWATSLSLSVSVTEIVECCPPGMAAYPIPNQKQQAGSRIHCSPPKPEVCTGIYSHFMSSYSPETKGPNLAIFLKKVWPCENAELWIRNTWISDLNLQLSIQQVLIFWVLNAVF